MFDVDGELQHTKIGGRRAADTGRVVPLPLKRYTVRRKRFASDSSGWRATAAVVVSSGGGK